MRGDSKSIIVFCLVAFGVTYLLEAWLWLSGGPEATPGVLLIVMFVPLLSAVITAKLAHESLWSYGIAKGSFKYYLYAYAYPFVVIALGLVFVFLLGTASIDFTKTGSFIVKYRRGPDIPIYLAVLILALLPFVNIFAFGEEYGWRGFLLPKLIRRFNLLVGLLLTGTIWGLWYAPLVLMSSIQKTAYYPHHPDLVGIAAFTVFAVLLGFFLGWLRLKSKSVFPAALGHAVVNAYIGLGAVIAPGEDELMTFPYGLPVMLALLVIVILAYIDLSRSIRSHGS